MAGTISTGGGEFDQVNIYPKTQATLDALTAAGYSHRNGDGLCNGSKSIANFVRSAIAKRMFGAHEVLAAAKQLVVLKGVAVVQDVDAICCFHMTFGWHKVVISNGAESESLFTGPQAPKSVGPAVIDEIFALFPELKDQHYMPIAAPCRR